MKSIRFYTSKKENKNISGSLGKLRPNLDHRRLLHLLFKGKSANEETVSGLSFALLEPTYLPFGVVFRSLLEFKMFLILTLGAVDQLSKEGETGQTV